MKTPARRLARAFLSSLLVFTLLPAGAMASSSTSSGDRAVRLATVEPAVTRIAGANRLETAVSISQYGWDLSDIVVIAAKGRFPDALAGGPLAAQFDAPILLTAGDGLSEDSAAEIERLGATKAIILGGEGAVDPQVVADLVAAGMAAEDIERIGGADRYATAALIAVRVAELAGGCENIVAATGLNFPDALGAAGPAGGFGWPILFVRQASIPPATQGAIDALAPQGSLVVGGEGVVGPEVFDALPEPTRVGGADRYETAALVAEYAFARGGTYQRVYLATGLDFPDALAIGPLAAREGSPILLSRLEFLPSATDDFLNSHCSAIEHVVVLGGVGVISAGIEAQVATAATEIVNTDAQEIEPATLSALETITPSGEMVFSSSNAQLADLVPGAVFSSEPDRAYPEGLFRLVTSVTEVGGKVIVQTTQATLADVLVKGSVDVTGTADEVPPVMPPVVDASAGSGHTLAITADGMLWAWGSNAEGELGNGEKSATPAKNPQPIGDDTDWRSVCAAGGYSFGIKQDGSLWAWGGNVDGRLGFPVSTANVTEPTLLSDAEWDQVAGYSAHSAGVRSDGTLWTWGSDFAGQRGEGPAAAAPAMTQIGTDTDWSYVDVGRTHTMALRDDGSMWGWGSSQFGQIGLGNTATVYTPTRIGTGKWKAVSAAHWHSIGIAEDGTLWGWGNNNQGTVGDGTTTHRYAPKLINAAIDWSEVSAQGSVSQALRDDGSRWAWGDGDFYGLALETHGDRTVPTKGPEDFPWLDLDCGGGVGIVGVDRRGEVWMAGDNAAGQLGDGTTTSRLELDRIVVEEDALVGSAASMLPAGAVAPAERLGSWWEGFDLRYYPGLSDWTFASWADQNPGTYYGPYVTFSGHASLSASFYFNASFDSSGLRGTAFYFYIEEGLSIWVDTRTLGGPYEGSIGMWPIPNMFLGRVYFTAGPVPLWVDFNLQVLTGVSGKVNAPFVHFQQYAGQTIGFSWDRYAGFSPINYGWNDTYCYAPDPYGPMSVKAWTSAELNAMLCGIVGPYIKFTGFGEVDANVAWDPWWKLELGLDGEVGAKLDFFDAIDESWSYTNPLIRWTVARASGPYPY